MGMQRGVIPAHLHFRDPNPEFDWSRLPIKITSEKVAWPTVAGRPARAAVNSFGLSGTNAHVVLEGYSTPVDGPFDNSRNICPAGSPRPVALPPTGVDGVSWDSDEPLVSRSTRLLPISGKSPGAIRELARDYLNWLNKSGGGMSAYSFVDALLADMAWTAGTGRSHFTHRAGLVFEDVDGLRIALEGLADSPEGSDPVEPPADPRLAFIYPGEGSQWVGMGETLYQTEPVFRAVLDRCSQLVQQERGASLLDVMFGQPGFAAYLDDPFWERPSVYALEAALTALWRSVGVQPAVVLGQGDRRNRGGAGCRSPQPGGRVAPGWRPVRSGSGLAAYQRNASRTDPDQ